MTKPITRQECDHWPIDPKGAEERRARVLATLDALDEARAQVATLRDCLQAALPYASRFWRSGEQPASCIAESLAVLDSTAEAAKAHDAAVAEKARREALEEAARIVEVSAEKPTQWDWSKLPGILRALASKPASLPDAFIMRGMANLRAAADATKCMRCGETRVDPEHVGACGECGGTGEVGR